MWGFATSQAGDVDIIAGTQTAFSGTVVMSNSNNVSFGMSNSSVVTATVAVPTLSFWDNIYEPEGLNAGWTYGSAYFFPLNQWLFPGNMTISTLNIDVSASAQSTGAHTVSLQLGIYVVSNNSTLSLINSVQTSWGFAATSNMSTKYNGMRWISIHSSLWSSQPVLSNASYIFGVNVLSSSQSQLLSFIGQQFNNGDQRSGTIGTSVVTATSLAQYPYGGQMTATTNALPASINVSALAQTNILFAPHMVFDNLVRSF